MERTPLAALRASSPGSPSLREMGERMGVSYEAIRRFESGDFKFAPKALTLYAKLLGVDIQLVQRMHLLTAIQHHKREAARLAKELKAMRGKPERRQVAASA